MTAIEINRLHKVYRRYHTQDIATVKDLFLKGLFQRDAVRRETFPALTDVSMSVAAGSMVGLIGSNGSGKSTLLKLVAGILHPTSGTLRIQGRLSALIELGAGFHPEFTGRENIRLNGIILGLSPREIEERMERIIAFSGLDTFVDSPVKTYSSGMYMRLGFAIAIHVDPDVLLIDEILAVGDEAFQHRCLHAINDLKRRGKTLLFVSHDLGSIKKLCDRVVWLQGGRVRADGDPQEVVDRYLEYVAEEEAQTLLVQNQQAWQAQGGNGQRWGTGEVELTQVRVLDAAGKERYVFESGEDMAIEMTYTVHKEVQDPVFGIGIFTGDGRCVYGSNTEIEGVSVGPLGFSGMVICRLQAVSLVDGTYHLDVAIVARDGPPYDYRSRFCTFVFRSNVKDTGIYRPAHRWELNPVSSADRVRGMDE